MHTHEKKKLRTLFIYNHYNNSNNNDITTANTMRIEYKMYVITDEYKF